MCLGSAQAAVGTYAWARSEHARGRTVSCGRGIRPGYAAWTEALDVAGEREANDWRSFSSVPEALAEGTKVDDTLEILEALEDLTPGEDELPEVARMLADAMTELERVTEARKKATADLRKQLDAALAPFKEPLENQQAVIDAAKAALVRRVMADEAAADKAIAARSEVPAPRTFPKGVQITRTASVASADCEALEDRFLSVVADVDAILAAVAAGEEVEGAKIETKVAVSLNRKIAGLLP